MTAASRVLLAACLVCLACQTRRIARDDQRAREAEPPPGDVQPDKTRPPVPTGPQALLADGAARRIQEALADRGYLKAPSGDTLDDATSAALRKYQQDEGLAATGFPDRETVRRLGVDPTKVYRDEKTSRRSQ